MPNLTERQPEEFVCAIVVSYFPDEKFVERLQQLREQVDALVVVDNSGSPVGQDNWLRLPLQRINAVLIANEGNEGIARALNQGLSYAQQFGCRWALTMDQDTTCRPGMVEHLGQIARQHPERPVIVGGNYFDASFGRAFVAPEGASDFLDQVTVITSGSLIPVAFSIGIGGFREDYFIDQVDHEFCLRARANGARIVISRMVVMEHSVGEPGGVFVPCLGTFPEHAPIRKYYIARNSLVTIFSYWRQEPRWCTRRAVRLALGLLAMLLLEKRGWEKARAFIAGAIDGSKYVMGPCRHHWLIGGPNG